MCDSQEHYQFWVPCNGLFVVILSKTMYNKIIRFCLCDILNNQGLSKCYLARPLACLTPWLFRMLQKPPL